MNTIDRDASTIRVLQRRVADLEVENERVKAALQACWDEYHELMPDDLYEQVKQVLDIRVFEGRISDPPTSCEELCMDECQGACGVL
jgi:hypothetical protein